MADETTKKTSSGKTQAADSSTAPESEGSAGLTQDPSDKSGPRSSSPESGGSTQGDDASTGTGGTSQGGQTGQSGQGTTQGRGGASRRH